MIICRAVRISHHLAVEKLELQIIISQSDLNWKMFTSRAVRILRPWPWSENFISSGHGEARAGNHHLSRGSSLEDDHFQSSENLSESGHGEARAGNQHFSIGSWWEDDHFQSREHFSESGHGEARAGNHHFSIGSYLEDDQFQSSENFT